MLDKPETDPFRPPEIPVLVHCLHCHLEYESYLIQWVESVSDGVTKGFWRCPTPGCGGAGFGFDIFPVDPEYRDEDGELMWYSDEEDDEEEDDVEFEDGEWIEDDLDQEFGSVDLPGATGRIDVDLDDDDIPY